MVQWCPTPRVEATFRSVFAHGLRLSAIVVGSDRPLNVEARVWAERLRAPPAEEHLRAAGFSSEAVLESIRSGRIEVWSGPSSHDPRLLNTDLFPRDEYRATEPLWAVRR